MSVAASHPAPDVVLIHPPVSLPSEPPIGLATLAAGLRGAGVHVRLIDANVEALSCLLADVVAEEACTRGQRRALKLRQRSMDQLRSRTGYANRDRHHAAVSVLRHLLELASNGCDVDLADYHDPERSPFRREDLLAAARADGPYAAYFRKLALRVSAMAPRIIGISINYLHQALPAMALAGALRTECRNARILVGGGLVTCWRGRLDPDDLRPLVDRIVFGPGARSLEEELDLDRGPAGLPAPDYDGVSWELYLTPERIVPVASSLGCHWGRCRYCPEAVTRDGLVLPFGEDLPRVMEVLCQQNDARVVHLTDSAIPPANLRRLAALKRTILWYGFTRFHPALAHREICRGLSRSGCLMLQLGLESGSSRVLGLLKKGIDLRQASSVLRELHDAGIATYLYVMFGTPGEGRGDALETLRFVVEHAEQIGFLNASLLNVPLTSAPGERPLPGGGDLSLYTGVSNEGGWDRREARRFLEREFAKHPAVAEILRRTPHVFGANHAPFFARAGIMNLRC